MLLKILIFLVIITFTLLAILFFLLQAIKLMLFANDILMLFYLEHTENGRVLKIKGRIALKLLKKIQLLKQKEIKKNV